MKRSDLLAALPDPDNVGAAEYRTIHNALFSFIDEWVSHEDEDVLNFALAVLSEITEWSTRMLVILAQDRLREKSL